MSEPGFVVGGTYGNAAGDYVVLAIEGGMVRVRYTRGFEMSLPANGLWEQWEQLVAERTGRPLNPRSTRVATAGDGAAPKRAPAERKESSSTRSRSSAAKATLKLSGDAAFYACAGYLSAGCELEASVAGRDYIQFAQKYKTWTGRNLITPHDGLEVHERPTHRMGAELSVRFPADSYTLRNLDFGKGVSAAAADDAPGYYRVQSNDLVERLLRSGFDLGPNNASLEVREKTPPEHHGNFDSGISVRRALKL